MNTETSGTRLKVRYLVQVFDDGAKAETFVGFFDTVRNEKCTVSADLGGQRCLPDHLVRYADVYTDAACTVRAIYAPTLTTTYAVLPTNKELYKLGAETATQGWLKSGASCIGYGLPVRPLETLIPTSEFVGGTLTER